MELRRWRVMMYKLASVAFAVALTVPVSALAAPAGAQTTDADPSDSAASTTGQTEGTEPTPPPSSGGGESSDEADATLEVQPLTISATEVYLDESFVVSGAGCPGPDWDRSLNWQVRVHETSSQPGESGGAVVAPGQLRAESSWIGPMVARQVNARGDSHVADDGSWQAQVVATVGPAGPPEYPYQLWLSARCATGDQADGIIDYAKVMVIVQDQQSTEPPYASLPNPAFTG